MLRLENLTDETVADIHGWLLDDATSSGNAITSVTLRRASFGKSLVYTSDKDELSFALLGVAMPPHRVTICTDGARTYVKVGKWGTFATERRAIVYRRKGGYLLRAKYGANTLFLEILLNKPKETRSSVDPVMRRAGPFSSIEIDVDAVHAMGMEWGEIVRNFTKKWIAENSFQGPATVWEWFTESLSFDNEQRTTCFLVGHGFPRNFMTNLATYMRLVLNNAVRSPSDYLTPNRNDGWSPTVHVQDSKAWLKLDEITWREV